MSLKILSSSCWGGHCDGRLSVEVLERSRSLSEDIADTLRLGECSSAPDARLTEDVFEDLFSFSLDLGLDPEGPPLPDFMSLKILRMVPAAPAGAGLWYFLSLRSSGCGECSEVYNPFSGRGPSIGAHPVMLALCQKFRLVFFSLPLLFPLLGVNIFLFFLARRIRWSSSRLS